MFTIFVTISGPVSGDHYNVHPEKYSGMVQTQGNKELLSLPEVMPLRNKKVIIAFKKALQAVKGRTKNDIEIQQMKLF